MAYDELAARYTEREGGSKGDWDVGGVLNAKTLKVDGTTLSAGTLAAVAGVGTRVYSIPLSEFKAPAAWKDALGDAAASGIFGLADAPGSVLVGTVSNGASVTNEAVAAFVLPPEYVAGSAITVRIRAKKDTTLATVSDTIDTVTKLVGDTLGADLSTTTAATQITTAFANYDFVITPTGLVAGDILAVDVKGISDDTGGTTNQEIQVSRVEVRLTIAS